MNATTTVNPHRERESARLRRELATLAAWMLAAAALAVAADHYERQVRAAQAADAYADCLFLAPEGETCEREARAMETP